MSPRRLLLMPMVGTLALLILMVHGVTAQSASGTVTGRVVWGPCIRGIPLPAAPDTQLQPVPVPAPGQPIPTNGLPAGAVLVAVQNTAINARTDEAGRFSLSGVPAGMYMTVAAGPVANAASAIAERPNVIVNGGQSVDLGTLSLGGPTLTGFGCRVLPGIGAPQGAEPGPPTTDTTPPAPDTTPPTDVPPNP